MKFERRYDGGVLLNQVLVSFASHEWRCMACISLGDVHSLLESCELSATIEVMALEHQMLLKFPNAAFFGDPLRVFKVKLEKAIDEVLNPKPEPVVRRSVVEQLAALEHDMCCNSEKNRLDSGRNSHYGNRGRWN